MEYKKLGRSGLDISVIGFGCMSLGTDETIAIPLLREALDKGINFFDTADLYDNGRNEEIVGKAFREHRKNIVIATKVGNQARVNGSGWDWNPRKEYILQAVEASLRRLQTDYIDLYQLHGGTIEDPIDETIAAFELLKQQGKIRAYGISSIRPNVIREYVKRSNIANVMMQYSLLDRRPEETCLPLLQQHQIGVLSRGSLAQGMLAGKPARDYLGLPATSVEAAASIVQSQSADRRSPAATAMRFVLQHAAITSAVAGIRNSVQLNEITDILNSSPISASEMELLREEIPSHFYRDHR